MTGDNRHEHGSEPPFITDLRNLMHSWGWDEETVAASLPKLLRIMERYGLVRTLPDGSYELTDLTLDEEVWNAVWKAANEEGIGGASAG